MPNIEKSKTLAPPQPQKKTHTTEIHDITLSDDYFWLREKTNPDVIKHLEAENAYTKKLLAHTEDFQETLYQEMLGRIQETDMSVPERIDDYFYYSRSEEGKQYSINCRKKLSLEKEEEIILDKNVLAEGHSYFSTGVLRVSPNHQFLAYSTDIDGSETYTLFIKDLSTGNLLADRLENVGSVAWAADNQTLFYTILDETKRPYKVMRHKLGATANHDEEVFHETDGSFYVAVRKTRSRKYVVIHTASKITTEIHVLEAENPNQDFQVIQPRQPGLEYDIEHHDQRFFILTNHDAVNFRLMETPVDSPAIENWQEIIAHDPSVKLDDILAFVHHLAVFERQAGLQQIRVIDLNTQTHHYIDFSEPVYSLWPASNTEFRTSQLRFHYSSLITPESIYDYDLKTKQKELKKQIEVLGEYDPSNYASERLMATSHDGAKIPISLVYKKGLIKNSNNPVFLYGYGSYGITMDPAFRSTRLSLIDRGFIYAIAHIRGGEELGRTWYESGKLLNKTNTFHDFIACAKHLIAQNYTAEKHIAISGGSAGGLLMGAVLNMNPELFKACIANVPFVDVLNTMLDETLPLTITEYDEWGNPNEKIYFDYIASYSPYDNIQPQNYPKMLVTAGLHDPRVSYWEPAKWVAKLRDTKTDDNSIMLKTNMGSGHSGVSGRYDFLKELATEYAFILDTFHLMK